jgi:glycosyltransferase involved in cell wall biosynthesis/SAM-dependent methyltransferase
VDPYECRPQKLYAYSSGVPEPPRNSPTIDSTFSCPQCGGVLHSENEHLRCEACDRKYEVVRGIPRFVEPLTRDVAQVQQVFDFEHRRYERSQLTQFEPLLIDQFLADCRIRPEFFRDKRVLDAGCGSGRWSYALAHLGADLTAVDLTAGGVESAYEELGALPNVRIAQANIFELPFNPETFDFVMSWGVLHHTPTTRGAFERLVPLVKPGGTLYVMVYEKGSRLMTAGKELLRFFLRRMSEDRRYAFCRHLVIDAKHRRLATVLSRLLMIAVHDPKTSPVDPESYQFGLFDAYSPRYNFTHTRDEVRGWFRELGFTNITVVDSPHGAVKVRGTKPSSSSVRQSRPSSSFANASVETNSWSRRFHETHGRPPRVLHLGNIANNAYLNAKIQRRAGIEADVASFDYYHVMGTPEWEDASFSGWVDEFYPDWWSVDLGGYERPRWFAQGPTLNCIDYLLALRGGEGDVESAWRRLRYETWLVSRQSRIARAARAGRLAKKAARHPRAAARRLAHVVAEPAGATRVGATASRTVWFGTLAVRKMIGLGRAIRAFSNGMSAKEALAVYVFPTKLRHVIQTMQENQLGDEDTADHSIITAAPGVAAIDPHKSADPLVRLFAERFPDRSDKLTPEDYEGWKHAAALWNPVFRLYDVVQAYATYPIMPLLAGTESFAAYEHGTLRDIPFEDSPTGRITALGYREAPVVFVTNADDLAAASRLAIPAERVIALPHAVDTRKLFDFAEGHVGLVPATESQVTLFAPARQDWVDGFRSQLKGNDRVVRALRIVRDRGDRVVCTFVDWGRHVAETKELIRELGLEDTVVWVSPLRKEELWRRYLEAHAIIDQFVMDAIGGVAFEAMALGRRVITALDEAVNEEFFGEAPPVLAASSPEEIAAAISRVLIDPADSEGVGARAREWVERFHSSERIVELQAAAYERVLARTRSDLRVP